MQKSGQTGGFVTAWGKLLNSGLHQFCLVLKKSCAAIKRV